MSADAWVQCPICQNRPDEYRNGIDHLYGKVLEEEFLILVRKLEKLKTKETVREDYEIYINEGGNLSISFSAKCVTCGAEWSFVKEDIKPL